jgi:tRNA dimethylallyltransferase
LLSKNSSFLTVLGPTAVGKSSTSLDIAREFGGEIVNCDSMQVYRGFDIGTDKLPVQKRRGIPHHLLDILEPKNQFTAADFVGLALKAIRDIISRQKLPIVTGGTGLYIRSLLEGLFPGGEGDIEIRKVLENEADEKGLEFLHRKLEKLDPAYASKIGAQDRVRIIRALEVFQATGKNMTENFFLTQSPVKEYKILKLGLRLERHVLYERIEKRVDRMFASGIVEETKRLLNSGIPDDAPPFRALGYNQVLSCLRGEIGREEAMELTKRETRRYAKRQMTWFKKMDGIQWFSPGEFEEIKDAVSGFLEKG